jgi:TolB-like protein
VQVMSDTSETISAHAAADSTIFISYSRDDQARALPIIRILEQAGYTVWWDGLLGGGERFSHITEAALERAKAVVVLWSKTSITSHWVHDEATRGRDRECLVPLSIDSSEPPLGFRQFQVISAPLAKTKTGTFEMQQLLAAVAHLHGDDAPVVDHRLTSSTNRISRRQWIIGATAVTASGAGLAVWRTGLLGGREAAINSIAVLPFANISQDKSQNYFSEGLSAEVRSMLARNAALKVMGQASSEAAAIAKADLVTTAKKLRVAYLLDGNVRIADNAVRIAIELIDGKTGFSKLTKTFDQPMAQILSLQREIAETVTAALTNEVAAAAKSGKIMGGTENVVAFDHYLRGRDLYINANDEAGDRAALAQFEAAIAADPDFAAAYAARSRSLTVIAGQFGNATELKFYHEAAVKSAKRAVALAPDLADAQSTLAFTLFQGGLNVKAAEKPFALSNTLGQGDAAVMARYAYYCAATGRAAEAGVAVQRALLLDPLNPLVHRSVGTVHYAARQFSAVIQPVRDALALNPKLSEAHSRIGFALLAENKNQAAFEECQQETHKWSGLSCLAIAQHKLGNMAEAKRALSGLVEDTDVVSFYQQGQVLSQWGDSNGAIMALQKAYDARDTGLIAARYDAMLDPIRKHPEFYKLLHLIGFD